MKARTGIRETSRAALFGVALTALACGQPPGNEAESALPIIGGRTDARHEAVGQVGASPLGSSDAVEWGCTGTLIGPRTVLTAAHCVVTETGRPRAAARTRFALGDEVFRVRRVFVADGYAPGGEGGWDDAALLILSRLPAVPALSVADTAPVEGSEVDVVGFGVTRPTGPNQGSGAGARRHTRIHLEAVSEREVFYFAEPRGACYGDSGGPLIQEKGEHQIVVGVTSRGSDIACEGLEIATRVDVLGDWIAGHRE